MEFDTSRYFSLIQQGEIEEAIRFRTSSVPEFLYKFIPLFDDDKENKKRFYSLANHMQWSAPATSQNDPFEFVGMFLDDEKLLEIGFSEENIFAFNQFLRASFNIISFCADGLTNLPMWAYYANNHKGFCVKYQVNSSQCIRSVMYEPKRIPFTNIFANFISKAKQFDETQDKESLRKVQMYSTIMQEMYFIKHESWKNENEYRVIYPVKRTGGCNVSVSELGLVLDSIYVGIKCSKHNQEKLEDIAKTLNVNIKKCSLSKDKFAVFEE